MSIQVRKKTYMSNLMQANKQWSSRPDDERFTSLNEMLRHFQEIRLHSRALVTGTKQVELRSDDLGLALYGKNGVGYRPTNWAFGQVATLANAPASYLRTLPSKMAAECVNYGLSKRENAEIGILLHKDADDFDLRAMTGPRYGRIWNADVTKALTTRFGDGVTGQWKVPGEFGKKLANVTKQNTTLFASDRDMWIFLADEANRIEFAGRNLARGFFVWNSETGAATFGLGMFLFDYVCCNRIIWGATEYQELRMRHSSGAPERFLNEAKPALMKYAESETQSVTLAIKDARSHKLSNPTEFLAKQFGPRVVEAIKATHKAEEHRPIQTRWDAVVGATAYARSISHQDARVEFERIAGDLLRN